MVGATGRRGLVTGPAAVAALWLLASLPAIAVQDELPKNDPAVAGAQDPLEHLARRLAVAPEPADRLPPAERSPVPQQRASIPALAAAPAPVPVQERQPLGGVLPRKSGDPSAPASETSFSSWLLNTVAALGVVVGLVWLTRAVILRLTGRMPVGSGGAAVQVLARVSVAPRNHIVLVRLGARILVLGDSPGGLTSLASIDDPEELAGLLGQIGGSRPTGGRRGFGQVLRSADDGYDTVLAQGADGQDHLCDRTRNQLAQLLGRLRSFRSEPRS